MPTSQAEGSQTAVIDTEHTLTTITTVGNYVLHVDLSNMVLGDRTLIRMKSKVRSASSSAQVYETVFFGLQQEPVLVSPPHTTLHELIVTIEQVDGTGRVYDWNVIAL